MQRAELAILVVMALAGLARWPDVHAAPAASDEIGAPSTVMVSMCDGVRLATDIYLPRSAAASGQRVAVILERTPYGEDEGGAEVFSIACSGQ